ncbi:MAG: response regulator [Saprospiraceae bacterium]
MPVKIVIVEDDDEIRKLTASVLNFYTDLECVGSFGTAETFEAAVPALRPDVVLMDIGLLGSAQNGIELVAQWTPKLPGTEFVMFTSHNEPEEIFRALAVGATGYVLKGAPPERLADAIREVAGGGSPMSSGIARLVVDSLRNKAHRPQKFDLLTEREQQVLLDLRDGKTYKDISTERFISTDTVRTHIRSIYEKLQVHSRTDAVNAVFGHA